MTSLKILSTTAVSAFLLVAPAAHAVVIPFTSDAVANLNATIEIEGGTIQIGTAPMVTATGSEMGIGPNTFAAAASASLVSSIDQGCITPTFGCVVDYSATASVSVSDGFAEADADITETVFQIVVETSAQLFIDILSVTQTAVNGFGSGDGPSGASASADVGQFFLGGSQVFAGPLATGLSESIMLDAGEYLLFIRALSANVEADQSFLVPVSAPQSLALLGFGLVALGSARKRRRVAK